MVGANATSYQNTGLTTNTSYSYRVRAFNAGTDSVYSNTATAVTQGAGVSASSNPGTPTVNSTQLNLPGTGDATKRAAFGSHASPGPAAYRFAEIAAVAAATEMSEHSLASSRHESFIGTGSWLRMARAFMRFDVVSVPTR